MLKIFDFISSRSDQACVRLVCKGWNRLMRPRMWREFRTSLQGSLVGDLDNSVGQENLGFLWIKSFEFGGRLCRPDYKWVLWRLMALFGKDQLLKFSSSRQTPLSWIQLRSLLHRQSNLRSLRFRLDSAQRDLEYMVSDAASHNSPFTLPLRSLRNLRVYFSPFSKEHSYHSSIQEYENTRIGQVIQAAPLLSALELCGGKEIKPNADIGRIFLKDILATRAIPIPIPFSPTIKRLLIADMDLSGAEAQLMKAVDFSTLQSLELQYCVEVVDVLLALATSIWQTGAQIKTLALRFNIEVMRNAQYFKHAVENLRFLFQPRRT